MKGKELEEGKNDGRKGEKEMKERNKEKERKERRREKERK
jgi:hypothetical protein